MFTFSFCKDNFFGSYGTDANPKQMNTQKNVAQQQFLVKTFGFTLVVVC